VVWTDDPKSDEVSQRCRKAGHDVMSVGRKGEAIRLVEQIPTPLGQSLVLEREGKMHKLALPLIGAYQAANVLTAAGLALATGGQWNSVFSAMQRVAPVRGRLERAVITKAGAPVYVDYAHTADALEAAIAALRPHVEGRLITLFGAGGDRDTGKRPDMGAVAARLSDVVIVTDDNPRSEDPAAIRAAIMAAAPGAIEVGGRREAIAEAIAMARSGDIVLLAGKGHETGQIVGDRILPFDDALVARECAA
jgi:UDP-N-acetylmuramoyl-L-alanyl-D-glutamate--2,6-diaminopimelate ligase